MILTYHMWWVLIFNWTSVIENLGLLHFIVLFSGLFAVTLILNPYWTYKKTQQLLRPVDWNFESKTTENGKLNGDTHQKKM